MGPIMQQHKQMRSETTLKKKKKNQESLLLRRQPCKHASMQVMHLHNPHNS